MGKFISGIFFFAISVAAFCFGTYFLYSATHTDDAASVIVGVIFIPGGLMFYGVGVLVGIVSEILLWSSFIHGAFKTACMIIAILLIAIAFASAGYVIYLAVFAG